MQRTARVQRMRQRHHVCCRDLVAYAGKRQRRKRLHRHAAAHAIRAARTAHTPAPALTLALTRLAALSLAAIVTVVPCRRLRLGRRGRRDSDVRVAHGLQLRVGDSLACQRAAAHPHQKQRRARHQRRLQRAVEAAAARAVRYVEAGDGGAQPQRPEQSVVVDADGASQVAVPQRPRVAARRHVPRATHAPRAREQLVCHQEGEDDFQHLIGQRARDAGSSPPAAVGRGRGRRPATIRRRLRVRCGRRRLGLGRRLRAQHRTRCRGTRHAINVPRQTLVGASVPRVGGRRASPHACRLRLRPPSMPHSGSVTRLPAARTRRAAPHGAPAPTS
mmetsp:Transcript_24389/g.84773  ORF Transcript_24389/g.84773 Transcript_24389/m.84773 type:complete len:332 (+) Transcript_24389:1173-2168(+)